MIGLLPCPFCGVEAEMLTAESMHGGNLYGVMCDCCASRTDVFDTEAEAIAAWNTRAERTCRCIIEDNMNDTEGMGDAWATCSECGMLLFVLTDPNSKQPNYCPNCGAKVIGG